MKLQEGKQNNLKKKKKRKRKNKEKIKTTLKFEEQGTKGIKEINKYTKKQLNKEWGSEK